MTSSSNFLHIRRGVETSSNKLESLYVRMYTMFEKISKYVKGNHGGTHTWKNSYKG
jgi:hypothetical protein